jgi:hypothetical protein
MCGCAAVAERIITALLLVFACTAVHADTLLGGRWSAVDAPEAVVELREIDGLWQGHIVAHATHPERVGTHVFRDFAPLPDKSRWRGRLYVPRRNREVDAELGLEGDRRFIARVSTLLGERRIEWQRLAAE